VKTVIDIDEFIDARARAIRKIQKGEKPGEPKELWKVQIVYEYEGVCAEICRADNYPHDNDQGAHIHLGKKVVFENLSLRTGLARVWDISRARIKALFNYDIGELR
jgi:hypothetical protein